MACLRMDSFLSKRNKIEASIGIFICPDCDSYSSNSDEEFNLHMDQFHSTIETIQCIYCNKIVNKKFTIHHTRYYYRSDFNSNLKCRSCDEFISIASLNDIYDHIKHFHPDNNGCINCEEHFETDVHLINHIKHSYASLYHCKMNDCKVKTNDYIEVVDHMKSQSHVEFKLEHIMTCNPLKLDEISNSIVKDEFIRKNRNDNSLDLYPCNTKDLNDRPIQKIIPEKVKRLKTINNNRDVDKEMYELVFMKEDFKRRNLIPCNDTDLMNKLSSVCKYKIGKPIDKDIKIYYCMSCNYASCYSFMDVKKHILSKHCLIHHTDVRANVTFISLKSPLKLSPCNLSSSSATTTSIIPVEHIAELSDAKDIKPLNAKFGDILKTDHSMGIPYSRRAFDVVYANKTDIDKEEILGKLNELEKYQIRVNMNVRPQVFFCGNCNFETNNSIVDVKQHIMAKHCHLEDNLMRDFSKLTKVNNQWNLLSDEAIVDLFDEQNSSKNQMMKTEATQQETYDDRETWALMNISNRKRKANFDF